MLFSELAFQSGVLERRKEETFRNNLTHAAFVGWQNLAVNGYKKSFDHYLGELGLKADSEKLTEKDRERIKEEAYATGQRVMNMFKGKIT